MKKEKNNHCLHCGQFKDYMDMNSKGLCKICWLQQVENKYNKSGQKTWKTRKEKYGVSGRKSS